MTDELAKVTEDLAAVLESQVMEQRKEKSNKTVMLCREPNHWENKWHIW